ncbi:Uncharacterised protein [Vibrio cholerae]|uniref:Uncharacterized protein n=1 Tax=Vibrio cholerae TaxID=666 RepID=A0A655UCJ3_VIBCL|nr:Uncharacterised protein [Vibrio cholerae]CSB00081.1 Uncharacterised protein [Vibrio cholerae]CSB06992.1 Uncharacterised protein [Vibrio cholerae]CSB15997.1 Uncharacterised protein [Vibrio cholerae]CSB18097.1 Uncharacterised protein [Vibrio cholerae]
MWVNIALYERREISTGLHVTDDRTYGPRKNQDQNCTKHRFRTNP